MKKPKLKAEKHSVDGLMLNVAKTLIQDFRFCLNDPTFCSNHLAEICKGDIVGIRATAPTCDYASDEPYSLKMAYQMQSLFKRYRFEKDLFTDDELRDAAIAKFKAVQVSNAAVDLNRLDSFTKRVLDGAALYIRHVLGEFDGDEYRSSCRFGRRASVGIPARKACEAERWELPLTGSLDQILWFDAEMREAECVQSYWAAQLTSDPTRSVYQEIESLKLTLVPKTFKSFRTIMPNTTIGSYMSYGLGVMIRNRLRAVGYDISSLQERHKSLARAASVHGMWTTLDLSSASDTISVQLVRRLFPPEWLFELERARIGNVTLPDGSQCEMETFCTMGVGYTFPLQTLVFLSILKSISALIEPGCRNTISVYGDDMIYPSWLHKHVVSTFEDVGFMVNIDKTYHVGHFRESCGGDYCHGVDVRPFQPQNGQASVGVKTYEAILYKYINTLLMRWSEYEVKGTLNYLLSEIGRVAGTAKVVPVDFPDDSGIKCPTLKHWSFLDQRTDVAKPKHLGHGVYRFSYLRFVIEEREEVRHEPYYWLSLSGLEPINDFHFDRLNPTRLPSRLQSLVERLVRRALIRSVEDAAGVSPLRWHESDQTVRSKLTGRRYRRLYSFVAVSHTGKYKRQSGTSCFEDRRQPA